MTTDITKEGLAKKISEALQTTVLEIEDISGGCGSAFRCLIVTKQFEGKKLIERQRMVTNAIAKEMETIHAFTFKRTWTPEQYEKKKDTLDS
mmetsp:Transcript_2598/g.3745  ORF Transcript_2598/g.3745 Transcript_2598/m.3745 type:complete len:92 (+) Transcript_2598:27-302(+)